MLAAAVPAAALAGDEDLTSSVYLVFDAETGEFVEMNDPNKVQQTHDMKGPEDAVDGDAITPRSSKFVAAAILAALLALFGIHRIVTRNRAAAD